VDLKRRLRMELAAQQGPGPLAAEIDKRLAAFETSRGRITWRAGPAFVRDLEALRVLIADRMAEHDVGAAIERLWPGRAAGDEGLNGDVAKVFAQDVSKAMAADSPVRSPINRTKAQRNARFFLHDRATTGRRPRTSRSRGRPGAPVSTPMTWTPVKTGSDQGLHRSERPPGEGTEGLGRRVRWRTALGKGDRASFESLEKPSRPQLVYDEPFNKTEALRGARLHIILRS
jgi:hypothetical protein